MRGVRALALEILVRVERDRAHAAPLLDARGSGLNPRDRDLLRALVKTTLRFAIRLDHVLSRHVSGGLGRLDPPVRNGLRLGASQLLLMDRIPSHAAVAETVGAVKALSSRGAGLANAVLRRVAAEEARPGRVELPEGARPLLRLALETAHPPWLVERWARMLGEPAAAAALRADNSEAPVDLLADPRAGSLDEIRARLLSGGVPTEVSPWAPLALTAEAGSPVVRHPLVASGALAVVDAAAQGLCELLPAADVVVDLAAAPGGKTRTLLARGKARRVVALERHLSRAVRLAANLRAASRRHEAWVVVADATRPPLRRRAFPAVLLDAPCSGTGTLRKNPEIRLRLLPDHLGGFASVQRRLLAAGLELLSPGGSLLFVTCSLEPEENEEIRAAARARLPDALALPAEKLSLPEPFRPFVSRDGLVRLPPGRTNDGFSAFVLRRGGRRA